MSTRLEPKPALLDRQPERAALDGLLGNLRSGRGGALVVRGEAGMGKSALLEYVAGAAADMRVARAAGVESEMELAFASLHLLCAPLLDRLERLPGPQRDALGIAFGLREGGAPDRFLVGLAVLTLLSEVAEERPLLCVVDDAQWLDRASAQVLAFAARRLLAEPVGLVFAAREPGEQFRGLADLEVRGLPEQDARALLGSVVRFRLDERVRDRIVAETAGNPLAVGLIAVGVGWLVGSLLPASSAEERAATKVKETAAPVVTDAAKDAAASLQDPAKQAAESVKAAATDAAAAVKDETASSAHDVRDQARAARDTVTDSRH